MSTIPITIPKWDNFNPRKDLKATTWVRLQNTIFEDPNFYDFTHAELMVWVYILCQASKKLTGDILLNLNHAHRVARLEPEVVHSAIKKLSDLDCVRIRNVDVTSTLRERNATNERTNERTYTPESTGKPVGFVPDLEAAYQGYPRKEGKSRGIAKLRREIKTEQDYADLVQAIRNYAAKVSGSELKFVKHFATFVGEWRDWINPDPTLLPTKPKLKILNVEDL